jgi:hypothetical protein
MSPMSSHQPPPEGQPVEPEQPGPGSTDAPEQLQRTAPLFLPSQHPPSVGGTPQAPRQVPFLARLREGYRAVWARIQAGIRSLGNRSLRKRTLDQ